MSACTPPDHAAFEAGSTRGLTPPLLPTLMMAAILGGASYLCHEPARVTTPAPVSTPVSTPVLASAVATAPQAMAEAPFVPASLAFASQFPLSVAALSEPATKAQPRPARIAAPRRAETPRVVAKGPDKVHDRGPSAPGKALAASDTPPPFGAEETSVAASEEGVLPEIALPFAPTIRAVSQAGAAAGAFVGAKSAAAGAFVEAKSAAAGAYVGARSVAAGAFVEAKSAALGAETATLGAALSGWVGRLR